MKMLKRSPNVGFWKMQRELKGRRRRSLAEASENVQFAPRQTYYKMYKKNKAGGSEWSGKNTLFAATAEAAFL